MVRTNILGPLPSTKEAFVLSFLNLHLKEHTVPVHLWSASECTVQSDGKTGVSAAVFGVEEGGAGVENETGGEVTSPPDARYLRNEPKDN